MASCTTSKWVSTSPQIKLTVTADSTTNTSVKYKLVLQYIASYAASTSSARSYTVKMDGVTVASGTYNINGKTGTKTIGTWYKTINKGTSSRSISFSCSMAFNLTWSGVKADTKSASGSISIAAKPSYKVTFNANGGSGAPSAQTKWYGTTLTLSSTKPTKSGYTFLGWSTSSTATSASYSAGGSYTANAAATLYAIWRKTITITYNANGGSGAPGASTGYAYNSNTSTSITLSGTKPTKSGYTFLGWSTNSAATSATYAAGTAYTFSSSVTLYAIWRKTITITYNANGGSNAPGVSIGYAYNSATSTSIKLQTGTPTKSGYTFLGWSTSSTATSATYSAGGTYTFSANATLYAIWRKGITITYDANGGENAPPTQTQYAYNSATSSAFTLSSSEPTRTDYNFLGWSIYSDATTATYAKGASVTLATNTTLYAVWELAHIKPAIYDIQAYRCDSEGNICDDGTYVSISASVTTVSEPKSFVYKYTIDGTEYTETPLYAVVGGSSLSSTPSTYEIVPNKLILGQSIASSGVGPFVDTNEYVISIVATDQYTSNTAYGLIPSLVVQLDISPAGVGIGDIAGYGLDVGYETRLKKAVAIGLESSTTDTFEVNYNSYFYKPIYDRFGEEIGNGLVTQLETDPDTTNQHLILTTNNTPSGKYMYIVTNFYSTKAASTLSTVSRMQIAYPYHYAGTIYYRYYFFNNKAWSSWYTIASNAAGSKVNLLSTGSSWITGKTTSNASINISTQQSQSSYHPYMAIKSSGGHVWNIGGLGNNIGIYGYYSGTTANQTDWSTYWDTSNGNLVHNQSIYLGNNDILYGTNTAGTRVEAMNLCSASNNLSLGYGQYVNGAGGSYLYGNNVHITSKNYLYMNKSIRWTANAQYLIGLTTGGVEKQLIGLGSANWIAVGYSDIVLGLRGSSVRLGSSTGTVVTSDRNLKEDIKDLDDRFIEFYNNLRPVSYKYSVGRSGRPHIGFIAQEVEEALNEAGLTTADFGGVCIDDVVYTEENKDDPYDDMNYAYNKGLKKVYSLRYEEFIGLNTRMNQRLYELVNEQQKSINTLQNKVSEQDERIAKLESLVQQLLDK